jgi:hypothetical protein
MQNKWRIDTKLFGGCFWCLVDCAIIAKCRQERSHMPERSCMRQFLKIAMQTSHQECLKTNICKWGFLHHFLCELLHSTGLELSNDVLGVSFRQSISSQHPGQHPLKVCREHHLWTLTMTSSGLHNMQCFFFCLFLFFIAMSTSENVLWLSCMKIWG